MAKKNEVIALIDQRIAELEKEVEDECSCTKCSFRAEHIIDELKSLREKINLE